jgi:hypothetical protein
MLLLFQSGRDLVCEGRLVTFQVLHQEKSVVGAKVNIIVVYFIDLLYVIATPELRSRQIFVQLRPVCRIRCFFTPWIRDEFFPDPGSF